MYEMVQLDVRLNLSQVENDIREIQKRMELKPIAVKLKLDDAEARNLAAQISKLVPPIKITIDASYIAEQIKAAVKQAGGGGQISPYGPSGVSQAPASRGGSFSRTATRMGTSGLEDLFSAGGFSALPAQYVRSSAVSPQPYPMLEESPLPPTSPTYARRRYSGKYQPPTQRPQTAIGDLVPPTSDPYEMAPLSQSGVSDLQPGEPFSEVRGGRGFSNRYLRRGFAASEFFMPMAQGIVSGFKGIYSGLKWAGRQIRSAYDWFSQGYANNGAMPGLNYQPIPQQVGAPAPGMAMGTYATNAAARMGGNAPGSRSALGSFSVGPVYTGMALNLLASGVQQFGRNMYTNQQASRMARFGNDPFAVGQAGHFGGLLSEGGLGETILRMGESMGMGGSYFSRRDADKYNYARDIGAIESAGARESSISALRMSGMSQSQSATSRRAMIEQRYQSGMFQAQNQFESDYAKYDRMAYEYDLKGKHKEAASIRSGEVERARSLVREQKSSLNKVKQAETEALERDIAGAAVGHDFAVKSANLTGVDNYGAGLMAIAGRFQSQIQQTDDPVRQRQLNEQQAAEVGAYQRQHLEGTRRIMGGRLSAGFSAASAVAAADNRRFASAQAGFNARRQDIVNETTSALAGVNPFSDPQRFVEISVTGFANQRAVDANNRLFSREHAMGLRQMDYSNRSAQQRFTGDFLGSALTGIDAERDRARTTMEPGRFRRAQRGFEIREAEARFSEIGRAAGARSDVSRIAAGTKSTELRTGGQDFAAMAQEATASIRNQIEMVRFDGGLTESEKQTKIKALQDSHRATMNEIKMQARESVTGGTAAALGGGIMFAGKSSSRLRPFEDIDKTINQIGNMDTGVGDTVRNISRRIARDLANRKDLERGQQRNAAGDPEQDARDQKAEDSKYLSTIAAATTAMVDLMKGMTRAH